MNRENLQKLADYLRSGNLLVPFDMATRIIKKDNNGNIISACAGGQALILFCEEGESVAETGLDVVNLLFPDIPLPDRFLNRGQMLHCQYICSAGWAKIDNTPEGAADRIDDILNGTVPEEWWNLFISSEN